MKTKYNFLAVLLFVSLFIFSACNNEDKDETKPVISNLEVGHNDTIHSGEEIHIEFEVSDNDQLKSYRIVIHPEGEEEHKNSAVGIYWDFDSSYTDIAGLRNYTVHHHSIVFPADAELGNYHFDLTIADMSGNVAEAELDLISAQGDGEDDDLE